MGSTNACHVRPSACPFIVNPRAQLTQPVTCIENGRSLYTSLSTCIEKDIQQTTSALLCLGEGFLWAGGGEQRAAGAQPRAAPLASLEPVVAPGAQCAVFRFHPVLSACTPDPRLGRQSPVTEPESLVRRPRLDVSGTMHQRRV